MPSPEYTGFGLYGSPHAAPTHTWAKRENAYHGYESRASLLSKSAPYWLKPASLADELAAELARSEAIRRNPFLGIGRSLAQIVAKQNRTDVFTNAGRWMGR